MTPIDQPTTAPEDEAFRRYRASGAPDDLARVFDATAPRLAVLAAHLVREAADAEDLVQQTFLVALRDAASWDGRRPVVAWLGGILRHRALDLLRRERTRATTGDEALAATASDAPSPLDAAADEELWNRVLAAIESIDGESRQVLALRLVHGLEPSAIAHALGRNPSTVRMQLMRGLEKLRLLVPASAVLLTALFADTASGLASVRARCSRSPRGSPRRRQQRARRHDLHRVDVARRRDRRRGVLGTSSSEPSP
ncbi:MAG: sigma-70 family RNA polymerase sigma factor [Planctomycetota bacterium]